MRTLNIKRKMKKIFRTISATIVAVLVLFTVVLTAAVLLNLIVAKSLPDMSIPMYRACGMAIFSSLACVYAAWHFEACGDGYVRLFAQGGFRAVLVYQR